ncbi:J domain-containing protein [Argonema antarcticum]|uniref:J domain-containing protein n=1 Tax=Argonema antarcticum TaxID=2942763 RepID=UPI0020128613|nr:J domain-containing protein [Argonema antarcticum]MCL1474826.1 J domain-containing protein [Argonema antarcticum A004/B2]
MNLADCYRLLGLKSGASMTDIKASYRRLARRYHPDVNPTDREAKDKFIAITEAYHFLLGVVKEVEISQDSRQSQTPPTASDSAKTPPPKTKVTRKEKPAEPEPQLSETEKQLKWQLYEQLQLLLKAQRFPRAIALVEGLAQRLPEDPEVRQWQAITYQRWGRHLVTEGELDKARIYLKKALRTDPHNRSLWSEVERDFRRLEQIY